MPRRPALLRRFPTLRAPAGSGPILQPEQTNAYPELATDIAVADREIGATFEESDRTALVAQNRYRRQQVLILLGSVVLSGLGGVQAVFSDQRWPGIVVGILGLVLATAGQLAGELKTLDAFLEERIKAERLRAAYFRFLSRRGRYDAPDDAERVRRLRLAVIAIKKGEEPS